MTRGDLKEIKLPRSADNTHRSLLLSGTSTSFKQGDNVLPLEGDIDLHVSPAVTQALNAMIKKKPERIVIDLSRATYIDSAGIAAFILAMQEVEAYGGRFFLSGVQETIRSILETSRLDRIFWIFPDVDAALAAKRAWFT